VSQHLKVLLDAGLVGVRSEGTRRIYALQDGGFLRLNLWLDQFWEE
jgi:DNA-binding transcriptional ArsR family regulator